MTYYLDEEIPVSFDVSSITGNTIVNYRVYNYSISGGTYAATPVYIGQAYLLEDQTTLEIDLCEILKMMRPNINIMKSTASATTSSNDFYTNWKVDLYNGDTRVESKSGIRVLMIYRYPNKALDYTVPKELQEEMAYIQPLESGLMPRVPYMRSDNMAFGFQYYPSYGYAKQTAPTIALQGSGLTLNGKCQFPVSEYGMADTYWTLEEIFADSVIDPTYINYTLTYIGKGSADPEEVNSVLMNLGYTEEEADAIRTNPPQVVVSTREESERDAAKSQFDAIAATTETGETKVGNWGGDCYLYIYSNTSKKYLLYAESALSGVHPEDSVEYLMTLGWSQVEAETLYGKIDEGETTLIYETTNESTFNNEVLNAERFFNVLTDTVGVPEKFTLAKLDRCVSKFYLMWQDRGGQIQMQPFDGQDDYTEDFSTVSIKSYKGEERNIYWGVESKWKLRTGWLDDETYPYYESIYASPYLVLYDTEEDKRYDVVLSDETYTEKKWENQHTAYNLEINLKLNKKQNIFN